MPTAFTELVSVRHPIALAPMGGTAGGLLTAAVSNAGGLGMIGAGRQDRAWVAREIEIAGRSTEAPFGIGFQSWSAEPETVELALSAGPAAVMLSFGDPGPLAGLVTSSGASLIVQVTTLDEARRALEVGADAIVAQGSEAGGHGGGRAALAFVPAVIDLAHPVPVLAAGGISDGRGLAAALALGAAGVLVGTRFNVSRESLLSPGLRERILASGAEDTVRSRTMDIAVSTGWPASYTARFVRNAVTEAWLGREDELEADSAARASYKEAAAEGDLDAVPVWAGEGIDLIDDVPSAAEIIEAMVAEARRLLGAAAALLEA